MKGIFFIVMAACFISCQGNESSNATNETSKTDSTVTPVVAVMKGDISKVKWIEGNWKGMDKDKPFYEHYALRGDSILTILTYDYNEKDTSNTDYSYVKWVNDAYYLGDSLNYKVVEMNENRIVMKANYHAANDILWAKKGPDAWDVELKTATRTVNYLMQRIPSLDSLTRRK